MTYTATMRMAASRLRFIARLMLLALLSVQGVHAAQACFAEADQPAMAFKGGHCAPSGHGHVAPNACLTQCLQSAQSNSIYHVEIPGPALAAPILIPASPAIRASSPLSRGLHSVPETGPPPPIRFCSFLL